MKLLLKKLLLNNQKLEINLLDINYPMSLIKMMRNKFISQG